MCEQTIRIRSRVEELTREHEKYKSKLKYLSQDHSVSCILQGDVTFLMPDEEHLNGFSQMNFHVNSCV